MSQNFKDFCLKFKNFYIKNKLACTLGVSTFLLFLSTMWHPFMYVMLAYLMVSMIFFSVQEILCSTFYFISFSGFLILFIGMTVYTFILLIIKYIIDVKKKRVKIHKLPLILTGAIVLLFSLIFYEVNDYSALQGVLIIAIFAFFYLAFAYRKQIEVKGCCKWLLLGVIVSAVIGVLVYLIPGTQIFAFKDWGLGLVSVKDIFFYTGDTNKRLQLLSFHINHLCVTCAFSIAFVVYEFIKKENKTKAEIAIYIVGAMFAIVTGVLTLSKAFLVIFSLIVVYAIIMAIVVYRKKSLKVVLPVIACILVFCLIFNKQIFSIINRFLQYDGYGNLLDKLTTGRVAIWKDFMSETFSNVWKALFGVGFFTKDVIDIGPHSLYVAIVYRLGILGLIALGVLIWSYIKEAGKLRYSLNSLFPMLVVLILAIQEAFLDERLYFLALAILIAFGSKSQKQLPENETELKENEIIEKAKTPETTEAKNLDKDVVDDKPNTTDLSEQSTQTKKTKTASKKTAQKVSK